MQRSCSEKAQKKEGRRGIPKKCGKSQKIQQYQGRITPYLNPTWPRHEAIRNPISPDVRYHSSVPGVTKKENKASLVFFNQHGGTQMKSLKMALMALLFTGLFTTQANAWGHADNGPYTVTIDDGRDSYGRHHYRHDRRSNQICRETVEVIRGRHGRYREVIRTVCRERDDWHRPRHYRDHYPRDRYRYNEGW